MYRLPVLPLDGAWPPPRRDGIAAPLVCLPASWPVQLLCHTQRPQPTTHRPGAVPRQHAAFEAAIPGRPGAGGASAAGAAAAHPPDRCRVLREELLHAAAHAAARGLRGRDSQDGRRRRQPAGQGPAARGGAAGGGGGGRAAAVQRARQGAARAAPAASAARGGGGAGLAPARALRPLRRLAPGPPRPQALPRHCAAGAGGAGGGLDVGVQPIIRPWSQRMAPSARPSCLRHFGSLTRHAAGALSTQAREFEGGPLALSYFLLSQLPVDDDVRQQLLEATSGGWGAGGGGRWERNTAAARLCWEPCFAHTACLPACSGRAAAGRVPAAGGTGKPGLPRLRRAPGPLHRRAAGAAGGVGAGAGAVGKRCTGGGLRI